jgi:PAS domain S-box-containing protein
MNKLQKIFLPATRTSFRICFTLLSLCVFLCTIPLRAQVSIFDEEWRWVSFTIESRLPSDHIETILETSSGIVWVQTSEGIAWYDGYQWISCDSTKGLPPKPNRILGEGLGDSILVADNNSLYAGNKDGFHLVVSRPITNAVAYSKNALLMLSNMRLYTLENGGLKPFSASVKNGDVNVYNLWKTKGGSIWINTRDGLFRIGNDRLVLQLPAGSLRFQVNSLIENDNGDGIASISGPLEQRGLWEWSNRSRPKKSFIENGDLLRSADIDLRDRVIALHQSGEVRLRLNDRWQTLSSLPLSLHNTTCVKFRGNGDLWAGTERGLFLYKQSSSRWTYKRHDAPDPRNRIHEILHAANGDIWLATAEGIEIQKPNGETKTITEINGNKLWEVTGLAQDNEGTVWISSGYGFEGAYRWDGRQWRGGGGPTSIFFHKIRKDKFGNLWFLGIARSDVPYDRDTSGAFQYAAGKLIHWGLREGLSNGRVYSFAEGTDGALWFGTYGGLNKWKNGTWTRWTTQQGLKENRIFCLAIDRSNTVWFGDQQNGLGCIDEKGSVKYYNTDDGLVDNRIWDLKIDAKGKLWIATEGGLGSYFKGTWSTFDTRTGLNSPTLWPVLPVGDKVYVGTVGNGLAILNLDESVQPSPRIILYPPLFQTDFTLLRWLPVAYWGELPSKEIMTRYKVDGDQWSGWNTRREVEISNLSLGRHTIDVQAKGLFGSFDLNGQSEVFVIGLPFYKEPGFLLPLGILLLAIVILGIIVLTRRKKHDMMIRESEAKFSALTGTTSSAIFILQNQSFQFLNKGTEILTEYSREELLRSNFLKIVHPDFREALEKYKFAKSQGEVSIPRFQLKISAKSGKERWIDYTAVEIMYGGTPAIMGTAFDITDQKAAEGALHQQQVEERVLLDHVPAMIWYKDAENRIVRVNKTAAEALGKKIVDLEGKSMYELYPDKAAQQHADDLEIMKSGKPKFGMMELFQTASGESRWIQTDKIPYRNDEGRIIGVIVFAQDITERRRADLLQSAMYKIEKAAESAEEIEELFTSVHSIIRDVIPAKNFSVALYNEKEGSLAFPYFIDEKNNIPGKQRARKGLTEYVFLTGESLICDAVRLKELKRLGKAELSGHIPATWLGVPVVRDKEIVGVIAVQDYSDAAAYGERERQILEYVASQVGKAIRRKRAEDILHESQEQYRELFDESEDAIVITSPKGNLMDINSAGLKLFGYEKREELLEANINRDLFVDPERRMVVQWQLQELGSAKDLEFSIKCKNGSRRIVRESIRAVRNADGAIIAYRSILRDITEQRQLEQRLIQSQETETLAAPVLEAEIRIEAAEEKSESVLEDEHREPDVSGRVIETVEIPTSEEEKTPDEPLPPIQQPGTTPGAANLNEVILEVQNFVETAFPKTINFDWRVDAAIPSIECEQKQIHEVLLHLCENARDSMPNGGLLSIEINVVDRATVRGKHPRAISNQYVCIQVIDTGIGINQRTGQGIFEPFIASQETGNDKEKGLAMVYSVVENHRGFIEVESAENVGTMFTLYFPVLETNGESEKSIHASETETR